MRRQPQSYSRLAGLAAASAAVGFFVGHYVIKRQNVRVNTKIRLDEKQARDTILVDDIEEKISLCRCWKSETFPLCDGSHKLHNLETGDNAGPVVIRRHPQEEKNQTNTPK